jgi:preprotein translocase subunit SecG
MQFLIDLFTENLVQILIVLHVLVALALIALIFLQQGKGSDIGASFGSGASSTVFGAQGSFSFLFKLTAVLAVVFFANSVLLSRWFVSHDNAQAQVVSNQGSSTSSPDLDSAPGAVVGKRKK